MTPTEPITQSPITPTISSTATAIKLAEEIPSVIEEAQKPKIHHFFHRAVLAAMGYSFSPEKIKRKEEPLKPLIADPGRFGVPNDSERRPLLNDRKGKGTRKQRRALNAKIEACKKRQAVKAGIEFNAYAAQHFN